MKFNILLPVMLVGVFILVRPAPAAAEFAVCNATAEGKVNVAWAATWTDSSGNAHAQSHGWWIVAQNDCKIVITSTDISAYTIYIYAFADKPSTQYWGGTYNYCLDPNDKFLFNGNAMLTPCPSGKAFGMRPVNSGGAGTYAYFLHD